VQTENKQKDVSCVKHIKDKRISYLYPVPPAEKILKTYAEYRAAGAMFDRPGCGGGIMK